MGGVVTGRVDDYHGACITMKPCLLKRGDDGTVGTRQAPTYESLEVKAPWCGHKCKDNGEGCRMGVMMSLIWHAGAGAMSATRRDTCPLM